MTFFTNFLNRNNVVVMVAYGGVGEFLFQLDLAKRFEQAEYEVLFLVKSKYTFFCDIAKETDLEMVSFKDASGWKYFAYMPYIWWLSIIRNVTIVNSFNSLFYRFPTKVFYGVARLCSASVVVSKHTHKHSYLYTQVPYHDKEMIWQRNCRIVEFVTKKKSNSIFPIIKFTRYSSLREKYIHIHPVGSSLQKSYPAKKLIAVLNHLVETNHTIVLTMTPSEERWYMTDELKHCINTHTKEIYYESKYFSAKEIITYIQNAEVFCTVNTGLLWLSILLSQKVVVLDIFTDYEWTPTPYTNVIRLGHDYDKNGESLHLITKSHEDGIYFESMYLITDTEAINAIIDAKNY